MRTLQEVMAEWFTPEEMAEIDAWVRREVRRIEAIKFKRRIMARKVRKTYAA